MFGPLSICSKKDNVTKGYEKMKIATITCQNADNHGARLQCYALYEWLRRQGNEVWVIDYRPLYMRGPKLLFWPGISIKGWAKLFLQLPARWQAVKRHRFFELFSSKYIRRTRIYNSIEELRIDPPVADLYLAGSDQIWNTSFMNGTDPGYYLDFGDENTRRESFAASFAVTEIDASKKAWIKENLKRFDRITVREQSALAILEDLGLRGELQEDPVFLLKASDWDLIADGEGLEENYILVYDFEEDGEIRKIAQDLSAEYSCPIFSISAIPMPYAQRNYVLAGPQTFVSLIKHAKCVISNSFHATAFSIIYNVPFRVVDREDGLNIRMHDLLKRYNYCK